MNERLCTTKHSDGHTNEHTNNQTNKHTYKQTNGRTDGRMDGPTDRDTDGRLDVFRFVCLSFCPFVRTCVCCLLLSVTVWTVDCCGQEAARGKSVGTSFRLPAGRRLLRSSLWLNALRVKKVVTWRCSMRRWTGRARKSLWATPLARVSMAIRCRRDQD